MNDSIDDPVEELTRLTEERKGWRNWGNKFLTISAISGSLGFSAGSYGLNLIHIVRNAPPTEDEVSVLITGLALTAVGGLGIVASVASAGMSALGYYRKKVLDYSIRDVEQSWKYQARNRDLQKSPEEVRSA